MVRTLIGQPLCVAQPIQAMDPGEVLGYGTGFVGLQRTDEVPVDRLRGGSARQRRYLGQGFLDIALPEIMQSGPLGGRDDRGGLPLAGADECDAVDTPAGLQRGGADSRPQAGEICGYVR